MAADPVPLDFVDNVVDIGLVRAQRALGRLRWAAIMVRREARRPLFGFTALGVLLDAAFDFVGNDATEKRLCQAATAYAAACRSAGMEPHALEIARTAYGWAEAAAAPFHADEPRRLA